MSKETLYREPIDPLVDWREEHPNMSPDQVALIREGFDQFAAYEHQKDKSICSDIARLCVAQLNDLNQKPFDVTIDVDECSTLDLLAMRDLVIWP